MNQNCWNGAGRLTKDAEFTTTKKGTPMSRKVLVCATCEFDGVCLRELVELLSSWTPAHVECRLRAAAADDTIQPGQADQAG